MTKKTYYKGVADWYEDELYERPVLVNCSFCHNAFREDEVKFINIHSDVFGQDVLTFECPECKLETEGLRYR